MSWNSAAPTEPVSMVAPPTHVITLSRPWYRRLRFMLPVGLVGGFVAGAVASQGAPPASSAIAASPRPSVARPVPAPTVTVTRTSTVRVTKVTTSPAVRAVLHAWTEPGPDPRRQAAAMARLRRHWPALAKALEKATGVAVPAAIRARR